MPEEMLDIVDDNDRVIGRERRSVVHARGLQHRGVHVFLFTRAGALLVQTRSRDRQAWPSSLDCSVSEHVKAGEGYLRAARRGLREELGLTDIRLKPVITFKMNYGPNDNEISRLYQGTLEDPACVQFDPVELESVEYVGLDELQKLRAAGSRPFSYWFEQMLLWMAGKPNELQVMRRHGGKRKP